MGHFVLINKGYRALFAVVQERGFFPIGQVNMLGIRCDKGTEIVYFGKVSKILGDKPQQTLRVGLSSWLAKSNTDCMHVLICMLGSIARTNQERLRPIFSV